MLLLTSYVQQTATISGRGSSKCWAENRTLSFKFFDQGKIEILDVRFFVKQIWMPGLILPPYLYDQMPPMTVRLLRVINWPIKSLISTDQLSMTARSKNPINQLLIVYEAEDMREKMNRERKVCSFFRYLYCTFSGESLLRP